ncbi:uncharacterized protein LOC131284687 [Anopheles ziemanni]|uniref:uncharacterized protein LOC131260387 n=1 Tax=Anopheles coustani TaxID=139045 RepID=UPI002658A826|nr:uncharacterized protein LOC131260387 [Anopheles coustani]XP_058169534.1 uncharacterized protein LOC131284687 [Anopheles ziemanni]
MMRSPPRPPGTAETPAASIAPAIGVIAPGPPTIESPFSRDSSTDPPEFQVEIVNTMRLKPPELDTTDIHTFFYALENWFDAWNIAPSHHVKRFNILKTQIPTRILPQLRHLLDNVPNVERYEAAKRTIVQHFEESQRSRLHRLLSDMNLGDRKPSQQLAEMRRTANGAISDSMLVDLWIGRLPPYIQSAVIAASPDVEDKAKVADSVLDSFALYHQTGAYQQVSEVRNGEVDRLTRQVAELTQRLDTVLNQLNRGRNRSRSRTRMQPAQSTSSVENDLCYYHQRYGQQARNCRAPCSFVNRQQRNNASSSSA